jgi:hypothetical protein
MVNLMGHTAMALLWAIPAWFVWENRLSPTFVGFAAIAAMLPDLDLLLQRLFPSVIHHHGVTHTVVFVLGASVLAGAITAVAFSGPLDRWTRGDRFDKRSAFAFVAGAYAVGGLSHLFADMLSAPDIASPIEPLWPFIEGSWGIDLIWYSSIWWNVGLLAVALAIHAMLAVTAHPFEHPFRLEEA